MPEYALWNGPLEIMGGFVISTFLPAGLLMWCTAWIRSSRLLFTVIRSQMLSTAELENS